MDNYDLTIIGAGWAGYNAAIRAEELGLKVALIDKDSLGGTCLNYGCIPTKSLIQSAKAYSLCKKSSNFGTESSQVRFDLSKIHSRKRQIIEQLGKGMSLTLKNKPKIRFFNAPAKLISGNEVSAGEESVKTKNILIASGSRPIELKNLKFDGKKILSSKELLNLEKVPESLLIIGGGVIGCEFANLFQILGSKVTLVELLPRILPQEDREVAKKLELNFKKRKIQINTNTDATGVNLDEYETILLCIGRTANTQNLGLVEAGVALEKNRVVVDAYLKTNIANIYAAGDCTGGLMLAHFAAYQGRIASENIAHADRPKKADNLAIPGCIFTHPEIGSVGLTEEQAKNQYQEVGVSKFDFLGSGFARIIDETQGFIKILWDKKTGKILGASIIGPNAVELIGILTLAIHAGLKISQLSSAVFAHPSLSEAIAEPLKDN